MKKYNNKIDVIIPAYNVADEILFRCLSSIACQQIVNDIEVTIVDDASTVQNYEKVAKSFEHIMPIKILRYETNGGAGVARQYGLDHTSNGYVTFIDADDTLNGAYALKSLKDGIEMQGDKFVACIGVFDEVHTDPNGIPMFFSHEQDMVWMFGKLYRRRFIDDTNIHFHETSRANEDNGFNTMLRLCTDDNNAINFIPMHVYYWHETENSITRANDCQYSYGSSDRDSFYGYTENMIFAIKGARKRRPYNGAINMFAVDVMFQLYEYYIECHARAYEHSVKNWEYCLWYYKEIYAELENTISEEIFQEQYNNVMRNAYMGDKLHGVIPCMSIYEFLAKLKEESQTKAS